MEPQLPQADIEAAVRRYLARVARRYAPLAVGLAALLLVVTLVPTVSPKKGSGGQGLQAGATTGGQAADGGTTAGQ